MSEPQRAPRDGSTHHVLVMNIKAGVMVASATPRKNRTVIKPP